MSNETINRNPTTIEDAEVEFARIRAEWNDWLEDPETDRASKEDFLFLLERARMAQQPGLTLRAALKKINPKESKDGRFIEITFSTLFDSDKLKALGLHFGDVVTINMTVEPPAIQTPEDEAEAGAEDEEDPAQQHLPFEGSSDDDSEDDDEEN